MKPTPSALAFLGLSLGPGARASFSDKCPGDIHLRHGESGSGSGVGDVDPRKWYFRVDCLRDSGAEHCSVLDLDHCFGNQDGKLVAAHDGAFSGSCHDCFVEDSVSGQGPIFQCRCDPIPGRSWVYPDQYIDVVDGSLRCFGEVAYDCFD